MSEASPLRQRFDDGLRIGEWYVEPMRNRIRREGQEVQLEPKVMEVLLCLADHPEKTVTKEAFKERVWEGTVVTDDVLSRCISELRKVFGDDPSDPEYIETIRKTGYRLIAPVHVEGSEASPRLDRDSVALDSSSEDAEQEQITRLYSAVTTWLGRDWPGVEGLRARAWIYGIAGLVGALLLAAGLYWYGTDGKEEEKNPMVATPFTSYSGQEMDPALSSDGRQVAFTWRRPENRTQSIYLLQDGAERPLSLSPDSTRDWSPAWSPNDRFLAYVRRLDGEHQVAIVPSIGGRSRPVLRFPQRRIHSIAWSPDTSQRVLAVSGQRHSHQAFGLFALVPETDSVSALTAPPLWSNGDTLPAFSPDGTRIAFLREEISGVGDIYVMPADGGSPTRVTTDRTTIHGLTWSSDGGDILFVARRNGLFGLWRIPAEGGDPALVHSAGEGTRISRLARTAQSRRLVYSQKSTEYDIWKLGRTSQYAELTARSLISSTRTDAAPSIGPDGSRVAFLSRRSGSDQVWVHREQEAHSTQLTSLKEAQIRSVEWSPSGDRLCFVARTKGLTNLYMISASGGTATRLSQSPAADLLPRWSPTGRWIYFASNRSGNWDIWRTRAVTDTAKVQRVTVGGAVAAQKAPKDSIIYFVRSDTLGLWAAPFDSTALPINLSSSPLLAEGPVDPQRKPWKAPSVLTRPLNDTSSSVQRVLDRFSPRDKENWRVDENGIHFTYRRAGRMILAYYDFASDRVLPLHEFQDWGPDQNVTVSPDGRWFAFTKAVRRESDIMLIDNFP